MLRVQIGLAKQHVPTVREEYRERAQKFINGTLLFYNILRSNLYKYQFFKKIENPKHWCQQHCISDSNNIPLTKVSPYFLGFKFIKILS